MDRPKITELQHIGIHTSIGVCIVLLVRTGALPCFCPVLAAAVGKDVFVLSVCNLKVRRPIGFSNMGFPGNFFYARSSRMPAAPGLHFAPKFKSGGGGNTYRAFATIQKLEFFIYAPRTVFVFVRKHCSFSCSIFVRCNVLRERTVDL